MALLRSTFLKEKQIHHFIKFSILFGLTDSYSQLYNHSTNMNIELDYNRNWNIKSCKSSSSLLCSDLVCVHVYVWLHQREKKARRKTHIWPTVRKNIPQAVKLSKILIILIAQFQYHPLWWMMTVTLTSYFR